MGPRKRINGIDRCCFRREIEISLIFFFFPVDTRKWKVKRDSKLFLFLFFLNFWYKKGFWFKGDLNFVVENDLFGNL